MEFWQTSNHFEFAVTTKPGLGTRWIKPTYGRETVDKSRQTLQISFLYHIIVNLLNIPIAI